MKTEAVLSPCGRYRYSLRREWDPNKTGVLFVMLNPSTADAEKDDPTIRKCIGFAKRWGYGSLEVVNLFAIRSTDPKGIALNADPVGPDNDNAIGRALFRCPQRIVAAWGARGGQTKRASLVQARLGPMALCLRRTKEGHPEHPLYIPYETEPVSFARPTPDPKEGCDD